MATSTFLEKYLTPIAVILGAVIIAVALAFGHGGAAPSGNTGGAAQAVDVSKVKTAGEPFVGNENAPVTIALWFDYQCPFCKQFDTDTLRQVYDKYVKAGKVKIIYKDFQFLGEDSATAALFGRALWDAYPDHYYEWLQAMFDAQDAEGDQGFGDLPSIEALTQKISGVDVAKVEALMNQNKARYQAAIDADKAEGVSFGINGTPGAIIGTSLLSGAHPYAEVSALIDKQLAGN